VIGAIRLSRSGVGTGGRTAARARVREARRRHPHDVDQGAARAGAVGTGGPWLNARGSGGQRLDPSSASGTGNKLPRTPSGWQSATLMTLLRHARQ
jgi:hypothetical protein